MPKDPRYRNPPKNGLDYGVGGAGFQNRTQERGFNLLLELWENREQHRTRPGHQGQLPRTVPESSAYIAGTLGNARNKGWLEDHGLIINLGMVQGGGTPHPSLPAAGIHQSGVLVWFTNACIPSAKSTPA